MIYFWFCRKRVWKLVYFVKVNGKLVPATSLPSLDLDKLVTSLNITGPRGQKYQIIQGDNSTLYSYRNRFSIFFTSKVTEKSLTSIQSALLATWNSSMKGITKFNIDININIFHCIYFTVYMSKPTSPLETKFHVWNR